MGTVRALRTDAAAEDKPRALAVAKLREQADRLERGEAWGCHVIWRDGWAEVKATDCLGSGTAEDPWRFEIKTFVVEE